MVIGYGMKCDKGGPDLIPVEAFRQDNAFSGEDLRRLWLR